MILTDKEIIKKIYNHEIIIEPKPIDEAIQPSSIDLRLGNEYWQMIKTEETLDPRNNEPKYNIINANAIVIPPNEFVLATTKEWVEIPTNLCARVEGRSSIGRLGVTVHITAGFIDAGFKGNITLEIKNLSPNSILLYEDMRVAQLVFEELTDYPNRAYGEAGNKYQNQKGVVGSLIYWDEDNHPTGSERGINND